VSGIRHSRVIWQVSKWLMLLWTKPWLRLRFEGREFVPRSGPVLIVANHASYLDPLLMGMAAPGFVAFLAQSGLARFAPLRWWLQQVGVSLIDRKAPSKEVLRQLQGALEAGGCVGMFPEGTRSRDGAVAPFRSGLEFLVRRTQATVVPMGIDGSARAFPRGALLPRPRKCVVRLGAPWLATRLLEPGGVEALRREVATLARAPIGAGSKVGNGPGVLPADPSSSADTRA